MPSTRLFSGTELVDEIQSFMDNMEIKYRNAFLALIENATKSPELIALIDRLSVGSSFYEISPQVDPIIDLISLDTSVLQSLSRQAMAGGGRVTAKSVGLEGRFDITNERAINYARNLSSEFVTGINKTVRKNLREIIGDAVEGNEPMSETIRRIKNEIGLTPQYSSAVTNYRKQLISSGRSIKDANKLSNNYAKKLLGKRAKTIARTEIAQAVNIGQHEFWKQMQDSGDLPPTTMRIWITHIDEKTCPTCGSLDGELTTIDGSWGIYNEPHAHPNCRCTSGLVFPTKLKKSDPLGWEYWLISKGEGPGHPFRGNQWTKSFGLSTKIGPENVEMLIAAPFRKLSARHGITADWQTVVAPSPEKRAQIAKAYADMPETNFSDPEVKKAWDDAEVEIKKQFKQLTEQDGIKVEIVDSDPYTNFYDMHQQVSKTGTLKIMSTKSTGGHPYWSDTTNDMFRAVHDAYGHLGTGRGFDRHGEEAAFQAHRSMFGASAQKALATELRAQNSSLIENGFFATQKVGFIPANLQKRHYYFVSKSSKLITADDDNAYKLGGSHHTSGGRHFTSVNNLNKGESVGHPFRGNQWTRVGGAVALLSTTKKPSSLKKPVKAKKTEEERDNDYGKLTTKGQNLYNAAPSNFTHDEAMNYARLGNKTKSRKLSDSETLEVCKLSPREASHYEGASLSSSHSEIMARIKSGKPVREPAAGMKVATQADILRLRKAGVQIAPDWSEVHVSISRTASRQVTGIDSKGRTQSGYSLKHKQDSAEQKWKDLPKVERALVKLDQKLTTDVAKGVDVAVASLLIRKMGLRPGGKGDTGGDATAFGATTLQARHVTVSGNTTTFEFVGKKGVPIKIKVKDPEIAAAMTAKLKGKRGETPLFTSNASQVNKYLEVNSGENITSKQLRTALATRTAFALMQGRRVPKTSKEAKQLRKTVAEQVSQLLGNSPAMALSSYINPAVFAKISHLLPTPKGK